MVDDAETENVTLSIRFVDERDYKKVSLPSPSGRRCWKKNRPIDYSSSEAESSSVFRSDNFAMPTLRSKVMVKVILTKVPALAPTKDQARKSLNCCRYCRIIFSGNRPIRLRVISLTITRIHNTWIFLVLKLHCPIENREYVYNSF